MDKTRFFFGLSALRPLVLLLLPSVLASCFGEPPVLTIGEVEFSDADLLTFNADRRTRLAELTAFGLAVSRGEGADLGRPLIRRRRQEAIMDVLERELALQRAGVSEEALQARYASAPDYELTVRHLVVLAEEWASGEEAGTAQSKAEEALIRIHAGEPFPQVAADVSEEPGASERGGLLQPGREGTWVEAFWSTAAALEVGEVSSVFRTPYGFHVLKLEGREPVPFQEARHRVVEDVAALLPEGGDVLQAWVDSAVAPVAVDSAIVRTAWEESGSLFPFLSHDLLTETPSAPVAEWPGGSYGGTELKAFLVALERPEWEHVREEGLDGLLRVATLAAHRAFLSELAADLGINLSPEKEASFTRDWEGSVASWAQALGFREGMRLDALKAAALNGVAASGQGARIAREELEGWAPMLLAAYPIGPKTP